jgi:hypothetical protein
LLSGGLRYAATTGYYLSALQAETLPLSARFDYNIDLALGSLI